MVSLVLVLVSFALVILAAVLLVLGLLIDNGLPLIYVSIACSVAAGVVLFVATQRNRGRPAEAPVAPAPLEREPTPVVTGVRDEPTAVAPATAVTTAPPPAAGRVEPAVEPGVAAGVDDDLDDDFFPIADYDDLKVSEIMPLLPELYPEELDEVEERERGGKARVSILDRIAELREQAGDREDEPVGVAAGAGGDDEGWDVTEDDWAPPAGDDGLPIADYGELTVAEIVPLLDELDDDELLAVREREAATDARSTVLGTIDRLLRGDEPAPAKRAAARRATNKRAAKRTAAKRTATKKRAAKRTAAKRTATKKRAAKKTAAKRTATKKRAAKKTAATKKRAGKKTAAKRTAATRSPAKKAVRKKRAAKKSAARRGTRKRA